MLLILSQKENAKQDILILVIMNVYMISSITLFSLTFCHCGPVFLSLLKCISSDGKCRGGAVIWVLWASPWKEQGSLPLTAPTTSGRLANKSPWPGLLGTLILTSLKYKSLRSFILKLYILPKMKKIHLPCGPLKCVWDWVICWSRNSPLWITSVL